MNEQLIFDTSIWIQHLNNVNTPASLLLQAYLDAGDEIAVTPTIVQEILQGIGQEGKYRRTKQLLLSLKLLKMRPYDAATGAADLYRSLRTKGVTIRKANDCLIAYFAITEGITLIHNDSDFDLIAANTSLKARRS